MIQIKFEAAAPKAAGFHYGPRDIVQSFEDENGEDDVKLLAISMISFFFACDNFTGDIAALEKAAQEVPSFVQFRKQIAGITGHPLSGECGM